MHRSFSLGSQQTMSGGDPRRAATTRFTLKPPGSQDSSPDIMSIMAIMFGLSGLLLKYRLFVWQAVVCCLMSLANMKTSDIDIKNITSSLSIGVMGLMMAYVGPNAKFFK